MEKSHLRRLQKLTHNRIGLGPLDDGGITLSIDPTLGDTPQGWQLLLHGPTERHKLALAVRFPDRVPNSSAMNRAPCCCA